MKLLLAAGVALLAATPLAAQGYGPEWVDDFDKAVAAAKAQKKDLLVDFTGSDWWGACIDLRERVWSQSSFTQSATQNFILVKLDFPQAPEIQAKVPNPARNEELKVKYNITGFPTVMLMTPDGEVYASTGNNGTGPEEYAQHVMDLRTKGKAALDTAKAIETEFANAKDKVAIVKKAISALNDLGAGAGPGEIYARVVRQGFALDPENKSGLKLESLKCLLNTEHAAQGEMDLALEMDPKNELGLMELVVVAEPMSAFSQPDEAVRDARVALFLEHAKTLLDLKTVHDKSKAAMAFAYAAFIHQNMRGELDKAKPFAQRALDLGGLPEHFVPPMQEILGMQ